MTREPAHRAWQLAAVALVALVALLAAPQATPEQASSDSRRAQSGYLDAGDEHTCAILADRTVRCWGRGLAGRLGYGGEGNVVTAGASGPVDLGSGRTARAIVSGDFHTCAILDTGGVRCWGFGANGRLGYGNQSNVLAPASAPTVDLGPGRTATAITAGASHTCVILDTGDVRCWGNGVSGRLGYGNQASIGDDESPGGAGPVDIGAGRRAVAISAGDFHTCAIRDDAQLVCWGFGSGGQLGYGGTSDIGDNESPGSVGPVNLGGIGVRAVSGGKGHTCALLNDGTVRCWGFGADGRLGYGGTANVTSALAAPPVNLGPGRVASAIAAGEAHTCAILDDSSVRCWGFGGNGRLGTGGTASIGDDAGETPASVPPVNLGAGRSARAITVGFSHSCAILDDTTARCWGFGGSGRLGYGDESSVLDPGPAGPLAMGGPVASTVADLRLGIAASAPQLAVGAVGTLTITLTNAGPDDTAGVEVSLPPPAGLTYRSGSSALGDFATGSGLWRPGALPPGVTATLTVSVAGSAPGTHVISAEVGSSSVLDPTSTPANGAAEDDRASVAVLVPGVAGRPDRLRPRTLGVKVVRRPATGRATRLIVSGALLLPRTLPALRCAGSVRVRAAAGRRVVARGTVRLRARRGVCRYALTLRPKATRSARTVKVRATFLGTPQLLPKASKPLTVRIR